MNFPALLIFCVAAALGGWAVWWPWRVEARRWRIGCLIFAAAELAVAAREVSFWVQVQPGHDLIRVDLLVSLPFTLLAMTGLLARRGMLERGLGRP